MKPYFRKAGNPASHTRVPLSASRFAHALLATSALAGCATTHAAAGDLLRRRGPRGADGRPASAGAPWSNCRGRCRCPARCSACRDRAARPSRPIRPRRVNQANAAARMQPVRDGFINSMQVYPFTQGALYQVYTAVGQITDIALAARRAARRLRPGRRRRHRALDHRRHRRAAQARRCQVHILVKPTRADLMTNLVINTNLRTYHMELRSTERHLHGVGLLAVSAGPAHRAAPPERRGAGRAAGRDRRRSRQRQLPLRDRGRSRAVAAAARLSMMAARSSSNSRAASARARCRRCSSSVPRATPPNWSTTASAATHMIVDRLFAAAELRFGSGRSPKRVRITRTDGRPAS